MSKKSRINKLLAILNKKYKPETKVVVLEENEEVANPEQDVIYIKIVSEQNITLKD